MKAILNNNQMKVSNLEVSAVGLITEIGLQRMESVIQSERNAITLFLPKKNINQHLKRS